MDRGKVGIGLSFHRPCGERRLNVENSVESVERFAFLPQDMGRFSPFSSGSSPYFGVRGQNEYDFYPVFPGQAFTFLMMSLTVSRRCWSFFMSRSMVLRE